jgi:hypothetical protein
LLEKEGIEGFKKKLHYPDTMKLAIVSHLQSNAAKSNSRCSKGSASICSINIQPTDRQHPDSKKYNSICICQSETVYCVCSEHPSGLASVRSCFKSVYRNNKQYNSICRHFQPTWSNCIGLSKRACKHLQKNCRCSHRLQQ